MISVICYELDEVGALSLTHKYFSFGFFESDTPANMYRRHNLLHAVKKLTREVTTLGRERVLTWYKGKGDGKYIICQV